MSGEPVNAQTPTSATEDFQRVFGEPGAVDSVTPPVADVAPKITSERSGLTGVPVSPPAPENAAQSPQSSEVILPPKVQQFLDSVLKAAEKYNAPEENKITSS